MRNGKRIPYHLLTINTYRLLTTTPKPNSKEMDLNIEANDQVLETNKAEEPPQNRTMRICNYILQVGMNPKEFVQSLLDSEITEIASRRQFWGTPIGWDSTERLILSIKKRVIESEQKDGTNRWSAFILNEVSLFHITALNPS